MLDGAGRDVPAGGLAAPVPVAPRTLVLLLCALPSVLGGDVENGAKRSGFTAFGSVWICWSLSHLVMVWPDSFLLCFAVAATDVAAWCGGKGLRRMAMAALPAVPFSPNNTVGGLVGAIIGAFVILTLLGTISIGLLDRGLHRRRLRRHSRVHVQATGPGQARRRLAARLRRPPRPDRLAIVVLPLGTS